MKNFVKLLTLTLISVAGLSSAASAGTITKAFEFGAGTANSVSNKRTFFIPCGLDVSTAVKVSRKGDAGATNDVDIVIELRSPGETADEEGPVAATKQGKATRTAQTFNLSANESQRGCNLPWVVRVKPESGRADVAIYGDITVTFNDNVKNLSVQDAGNMNLNSRNTETVNIGSSGGLDQGMVTIKGEWFHNLGVAPIKLKIELLDPNDNPVASDTGYSNLEVNPCCSGQKLKINYMVPALKRGQWKLRIKNVSDGHDAVRVKPIASLKPDCPN
jgi:hypothetical protein